MALSESAVEELLAALAVGEGTDLVRELAGWAVQELIELEAVEAIGAGLWGSEILSWLVMRRFGIR